MELFLPKCTTFYEDFYQNERLFHGIKLV